MAEVVRNRIAEAFMVLVARMPYKRVTVAELTRYLNYDRKTFYNYFENIDQLMVWIYRDYLETMLERPGFSSWEKVSPGTRSHDPYPTMLFYARNYRDGKLCQGQYFKEMAYHWEEHRKYYSVVFSTNNYLNMFDYIIELFLEMFREDVLILLGERELPPIVVDFLAEYHAMGVFGRLRYHYALTNKFIMQPELDAFWNYAHDTLERSIALYCDGETSEPTVPFIKCSRQRSRQGILA